MANSPAKLLSRGKPVSTAMLGKLYTFKYRATEDLTPYYDMYPTVIVMRRFAGGFSGLNFNYIDHELRATLMNTLKEFLIYKSGQKFFLFKQLQTRLNQRAFRPALVCIRSYRYENCQTPLIKVDDTIWDETIHLCEEMFIKVNPETKSKSLLRSQIVWRDSLRRIRRSE